jgi:serine/threonine protein kinase
LPFEAKPLHVATVADAFGVGSSCGGYVVTSVVGPGPAGTVYLAEHVGHDETVALKVLAPDLAGSEEFCERFLADCRVAATLDHPGPIPIFEAERLGGSLYVARKHVDGADLGTMLRDVRLSQEQAWTIVEQVAGALQAAHSQGLVHRDLKPSNILVESGTRRVYVTDFGMEARALDYAAPEQIAGKRPDARADVYSLGRVLADCLDEVPSGLQPVIARATAQEPDDRYPTALEFAAACREPLAPRPDPLPPRAVVALPVAVEPDDTPERPRHRRLRIALAVAALLAAGIAAGVVLTRGNDGKPTATSPPQPVRPRLATRLRADLAPAQRTLTDRVRTGDLKSIEEAASALNDDLGRTQSWLATVAPRTAADRIVFSAFVRAVNAQAAYAASLANLAPASTIAKAEAQAVIAKAARAERAYRQLRLAAPQMPAMPLRREDSLRILEFVPPSKPIYDVVAFSGGEGVRYRTDPTQWCGDAPSTDPCWQSVVPGLGAAEGHWLRIYCYTAGASVHGNTWWAKVRLEPAEYVPATFLRKGHDGRPAGVPAC